MRQTGLFFTRFAIALWAILVSAFLGLLISNAPMIVTVPFGNVAIAAPEQPALIRLPNRIFDCIETDQEFQCQAELQDRSLNLTLTKGESHAHDFSTCRATYNDQTVPCEKTGGNYIRGLQYDARLKGNLGLNHQQLQALRQEFWGINALLGLGENRLMWIGAGFSVATGLFAATLSWQHPGGLAKAIASLTCGLGAIGWGSMIHEWFFDLSVPPIWLRPGVLVAVCIGTILVVGIALYRSPNRLTKTLACLGAGLGIHGLCFWALFWIVPQLFEFVTSFLWALGWEGILPKTTRWLAPSLPIWVATVPAAAAGLLLWRHTKPALRSFVSLANSFGGAALASWVAVMLLLCLGYAD